jgi:hypothetical protein
MKLLLDPRVHASVQDALNFTRSRPESEAVESMQRAAVLIDLLR